MSKILIIGTNSFVGTNFEKYSKFNDIESVSLIENKPNQISFNGYNIVLHFAAIVHQKKSIPEEEYFRVNRDLCIEVAKNAKKAGVGQFIFMSTVKVYGDRGASTKILNENSPCNPKDSYGKSKYEAELKLKEIENDNFKIAVIRTPLVYGDGVKANMLKMIKLVDKFSWIPLGKINNRRSMAYVRNLVEYIDRIIETQKAGTFIIQDENPISTTELVNYIAVGLSKRVRLIKIPGVLIKIGSIFFPNTKSRLFDSLEFDNTFTKEKLNYKPNYSTKEGVVRMVKAYLKNK